MQKSINLSKDISIHGLDIGNTMLKSHKKIILDSKITTIEPMTKADTMIIDNETYYLGFGSLDTTYRKVEKKHYLDMLYGLLALNTDTVHNYISIGLPLGQIKEDRNQLTNLIMRNNEKTVRINDIEKPLIIEDVFIAPEGVASLEDAFEGVVVDIGGGSTDTALVVNEREKRKIINPISIPRGTIKLYTDFANKLNNKYGLELTMDDSERILKNGLLLDGKKVDINFALEMYREYTEALISQLQVNYSLRTNYISLTGGGATILYEQLTSRLGDALILQADSIFANANAFYDIGLSVFGEE